MSTITIKLKEPAPAVLTLNMLYGNDTFYFKEFKNEYFIKISDPSSSKNLSKVFRLDTGRIEEWCNEAEVCYVDATLEITL